MADSRAMSSLGSRGEPGESPATPESGAGGPPRRSRRRLRRVLKWAAISIATLTALLFFGGWILLANLNRPAIKSRVVALVKDASGLTIDYEALEVSVWSGVSARSFSILSPAKFAEHAPSFVRVEGLEVSAALWSLAFGLEVDSVEIESIEIVVVKDELGATTLSELFPPSEKPDEPDKDDKASPLSRTLLDKLPEIAVDRIAIRKITGRLIELTGESTARTTSVEQLAVEGRVRSGGGGLSGTEIEITTPPMLRLARQGADGVRTGDLAVSLKLRGVDDHSIEVQATIDLQQQDLVVTTSPIKKILDVDLAVRFDPAAEKTTMTVATLDALDGRIRVNGTAELPDGETLSVIGSGTAKVALDSLPIALGGTTLRALDIDLAATRLSWSGGRLGGHATLAASLAQLGVVLEDGAAELGGAALSADVAFDDVGGDADSRGTIAAGLTLASASASTASSKGELRALGLDLKGEVTSAAAGTGQGGDPGKQDLAITADLKLASASAQGPARARASSQNVVVSANLSGALAAVMLGSIENLAASAKLAVLKVADGSGASAGLNGTELAVTARGVALDPAAPFGASGNAELVATIPALNAASGGQRFAGSGLKLAIKAPLSLASATGTVSVASMSTPDQSARGVELGFELVSPLTLAPGSVGVGSVGSATSAALAGSIGAFRVGDSRGGLPSLRLVANKVGSDAYHLELDATGSSLVAIGKPLPGRVTANVRADAAIGAAVLDVSADVRGPGGALATLALDAGFDRRSGRLRYKASVLAEKLESFATALAAVDAGAARVKLKGARLAATAKGELRGLLRGRGRDVPSLVSDPLASMRGTQSVTIDLRGLDYREPGVTRRLKSPAFAFAFSSVHGEAGAGSAEATVTSEAIDIKNGAQRIKVGGLSEVIVATFDAPPDRGLVKLTSKLAVGSVSQTAFGPYKVADLTLDGDLEIDRLQSIFIRELTLKNPASGTILRASGALEQTGAGTSRDADSIPGREALTLEGRLTQKLEHVGGWGFAESAGGSLVVPFRLESGDLLSYRFAAKLMARGVTYVSRDKSIVIRDLNGVIPMSEELALLPSGVVVIPGPKTSPLSRARFFDINPFLDSDDYVTAKQIVVGGQILGPLAGNVRFARSVFSIDQLQVGYRGGQIAGQVHAAYREGDPIVRMRLNITGVRPENSSEVLDANAALTFVPRTLALDGKIQIVRLAKDHLLDLLNILDPYHETVNVNKVRLGLKVGYPKFVRLQLHDGTIDAKVELGGAAKVVRIDEIKAVPLGSIMQIYVVPVISTLLPPHLSPQGRPSSQPVSPTPSDSQEIDAGND